MIFLYAIQYILNPDTPDQKFNATVINICRAGPCLSSFNSLSDGQEIIINTILPTPYQKAIVRWVSKFDDNNYKVGLELLYPKGSDAWPGPALLYF